VTGWEVVFYCFQHLFLYISLIASANKKNVLAQNSRVWAIGHLYYLLMCHMKEWLYDCGWQTKERNVFLPDFWENGKICWLSLIDSKLMAG